MSRSDKINVKLTKLANGAVQEKLDRSMADVIDNILNLNTDPEKPRKVTIDLTIKPNKTRDSASVTTVVKTKLQPELEVPATVLLGRDETGHVVMNELLSGAKGQTFIDPDDGKLKEDDGTPIPDVGEPESTPKPSEQTSAPIGFNSAKQAKEAK